jgi:hypothetical protein
LKTLKKLLAVVLETIAGVSRRFLLLGMATVAPIAAATVATAAVAMEAATATVTPIGRLIEVATAEAITRRIKLLRNSFAGVPATEIPNVLTIARMITMVVLALTTSSTFVLATLVVRKQILLRHVESMALQGMIIPMKCL